MGILAGDALLNYAYETAAKALLASPSDPAVAKAFALLAQKAGIYGMVGGQVVDVESEDQPDIERDKLDFIYQLKTGALIEASMMIGAILAGAEEEAVAKTGQIAEKVGLAFQIQDDILDRTSTLEVLGKPVGSDVKNHKSTYVTFEGIEQSQKDVERLSEEALELLFSFPEKNPFLEELLRYLIHRKK